MQDESQNKIDPEAERRRARAKIRTIRIWAMVILSLLFAVFLLSQCALSKPKAKQAIVESCIKNIPFSEKWQTDLEKKGLSKQSEQWIDDYCICMWDEPLDKLTEKQIHSLSSLNPNEQLELLGGAAAFEQRDQQCIAALGNE